MDRILSARVDEAVARRITALARQLGTTKKSVIEQAVQALVDKLGAEADFLTATSGAWQREEEADQTVEQGRAAFRRGMMRHRDLEP